MQIGNITYYVIQLSYTMEKHFRWLNMEMLWVIRELSNHAGQFYNNFNFSRLIFLLCFMEKILISYTKIDNNIWP